MKTGTLGACLVLYCGLVPIAMANPLLGKLNPSDSSVPADPMSYFKDSPEQKAARQRAKNVCSPMDVYELLDDQAGLEALSE